MSGGWTTLSGGWPVAGEPPHRRQGPLGCLGRRAHRPTVTYAKDEVLRVHSGSLGPDFLLEVPLLRYVHSGPPGGSGIDGTGGPVSHSQPGRLSTLSNHRDILLGAGGDEKGSHSRRACTQPVPGTAGALVSPGIRWGAWCGRREC